MNKRICLNIIVGAILMSTIFANLSLKHENESLQSKIKEMVTPENLQLASELLYEAGYNDGYEAAKDNNNNNSDNNITIEEPEIPMSQMRTERSSFKSYMDWRRITSKSSNQYKLQQDAYTDEFGLRRYGEDGLYMVAVSSKYGKVGDKITVALSDESWF